MVLQRTELLEKLGMLRDRSKEAVAEFNQTYQDEVAAYRQQITIGISELLTELQQSVNEIAAGNEICAQLVSQAIEYIDWLQWSLWDLPYFAILQRPSAKQFREAVASCGLIYLSIRIFDDVIDRHFWYKGKQPTLLSATSETAANSQGAEGLTILAGLLLCFTGFAKLAAASSENAQPMLRAVLHAARNAVIGAIMEQSEPQFWNADYYARLVQLKNVDYWRSLYAALDPEGQSPIYPFLIRYYTLAQYLNDVQDVAEDKARGQPNLLALYIQEQEAGTLPISLNGQHKPEIPTEAELLIANIFFELDEMAQQLPALERLVAQFKLAESYENAYKYGLFTTPTTAEPGLTVPPPKPTFGIHWYSNLQTVIEQAGLDVLVKTDCPICSSTERNYLFRKNGFVYHRCQKCSHIYVSPRITAALQTQIAEELDKEDEEDGYMKIQRIYAANICRLLRAKAPGNRFLDIGFGHGYLLELAQAYGFEVYGMDSSRAMIDRLWPRLGHRLFRGVVGRDELPWDSFDVVVMTHVLEHLPDPQRSLHEIYERMNPRAILYAAVPDTDSMPFKIFGKKWDVINPLVHFQYFNEQSFSQLIETAGFTNLKRIEHLPIPPELASRWMRLMQKLSGSDASDITMMAQVPEKK